MGGLFGGGNTTYVEGNRISEFQVNASAFGECVPVIYGTTRLSGNVIDWADFKEHAHTETHKTGKGGGGSKTVTTTYTYTVKVLLGLCEGPIAKVLRVWKDKEIVTLPDAGFNLFLGTEGQAAWTGLQGYGDGLHFLPYNRLAYVAGEIDLHSSGSLPNFNFEVAGLLCSSGDGIDANPADVILDIVTNNVYGLGYSATSIDLTSLGNYREYCRAADLLISLPGECQDVDAVSLINDILTATNSIGIWSDKKLKIIPLAEDFVGTWVPDMTPKYTLGDDDFCPDDNEPAVTFERSDSSDSYNEISIEFYNRTNSYEKEVVAYQVLSDISKRGLVPAAKKTMYFLHTKARAMYVAEQMAVRSIYVRNKYIFKLDWTYGLLEPGDLVTISNAKLGLNETLVRVSSKEEDADGMLSITAIGVRAGLAAHGNYPSDPERVTVNTNVNPGDVEPPEIFELPYQSNQREVGIALCGLTPKWGGAQIWMSFDNLAYEYIGETWAPARYGKIKSAMTDTQQIINVEFVYPSQILNNTSISAQAGATMSLVEDEWVTYETAELTGAAAYNLSGITRGLYGVAPQSHVVGARFVIIDNAVFRHTFRVEDTGRNVYLKFLSFNVYGTNTQAIDEVNAYSYTIKGPTPMYAPENLYATGIMRGVKISWDAPDGNQDVTGYEIWANTKNSSIAEANKIGETRDLSFLCDGLGVLQTIWCWVNAYDYGHNSGPFAGPVSGTTKALEMEDIPEQSITPSKLFPKLEALTEEIKQLANSGIINGINAEENRTTAAVAVRKLDTKVVDGLSAEASERLLLAARVNDNVAAIQAESVARANADSAEASEREILAAKVGKNTAGIQTTANAVATVDGKVGALYTLRVDANGNIAGFAIGSDGVVSEFAVVADKFKIAKADGTATQIFTLDTDSGLVQIIGDLIASGSITGDKINAASQIQLGAGGKLIIGQGGVIQIGETIVIDGGSGDFFP